MWIKCRKRSIHMALWPRKHICDKIGFQIEIFRFSYSAVQEVKGKIDQMHKTTENLESLEHESDWIKLCKSWSVLLSNTHTLHSKEMSYSAE